MGDKVKYKSGLVDPGQREAQTALLNRAREGDPSLLRDRNTFLKQADLFNPLSEEAGSFLSGIISSNDPLGMRDMMERYRQIGSGATDPLPDDGLFGNMIRNIETAGTRAREAAMAAGSKYGNQFSSASRAAGIAAETEGNVSGKAKVAELIMQRQAQREKMRFEAAGLFAQAAKFAIDSKMTASQLQTAANNWAKGMAYQEWARLHPSAAQLLEVIYGKNIDTIAEKQKSWVGPALMGVAALVGTIASGGTATPVLLGALANAASAAGGGSSVYTPPAK